MFSFLIQTLFLFYLLYILLGGRSHHYRNDSSRQNTGGNWQNAWETDNSCAAAYRILGVPQSASIDEIKAAYRKLAIKFHPDKYETQSPQVQKDAEQKFKEVNQAYEIIKKARNFS